MAEENSNVPPSGTPNPPKVSIGIPVPNSSEAIKVQPKKDSGSIPVTPKEEGVPKAAELPKITPKKETVRITLPPKPTSAPTVKIPAPAAAAPTATAAPVAGHAAPPLPPSAVPPVSAGATPPPPNLRKPTAAPAKVDKLDIGLAVTAAVAGIAALVRVFMLGGE